MSLLFSRIVYLKIYRNRYEITLPDKQEVITSVQSPVPFSTARLLVGQLHAAATCLEQAVKEAYGWSLPMMGPVLLIHPCDMVEGGLSEVEDHTLRELAFMAGAEKAAIWLGNSLTVEQVHEKAKGAMARIPLWEQDLDDA
ncbi:MAG: hypothetical protein Q9M09_06055 [Mariprofundaceae bacterium]|nr:hypothetical protein [Mariprofundaceae bacterium]